MGKISSSLLSQFLFSEKLLLKIINFWNEEFNHFFSENKGFYVYRTSLEIMASVPLKQSDSDPRGKISKLKKRTCLLFQIRTIVNREIIKIS